MTLERRYWIWDAVLLVSLAAALRVHDLGANPLTRTEALQALGARAYAESGIFSLPSGMDIPNGKLSMFIQSTLFAMEGESEWMARAPAAFFSILLTIWLYLWAAHWFGAWCGRISGLLFAILPWAICWGRLGSFFSLFMWLYFLLVVSTWKIMEGNCLGHPIFSAVGISRARGWIFNRCLRLGPCLALLGLLFMTSWNAMIAILFIPAYLIVRMAWLWPDRQSEARTEFRRTLLYVLALALIGLIGDPVWNFLTGRPIEAAPIVESPPMEPILNWRVESLDFLLLFAVAAFGVGCAMRIGRQGWLIALALWVPGIAQALVSGIPALPYYTFPLFILLVSLPLASGVETLIHAFNQRFSIAEKFNLNVWAWLAGMAVMLIILARVVVLNENGSAALFAHQDSDGMSSADWRALSDETASLDGSALVVTTDPLLCWHYLGGVDYVYPFVLPEGVERDPETGAPALKDDLSLLRLLDSSVDVWILGSLEAFQKSRATPRGERLWSLVSQPPAVVKMGQREALIFWKRQ